MQFSHHNRAGTAISFSAADFGAMQVLMIPDKIKYRRAPGKHRMDRIVIENKSDHTKIKQ